MAEEFKGLNKETLKNVESIKSSMLDIAKATASANKSLQDTDAYLTAYQSSYRAINASADKFSQIQLDASKSAKATTEAFKEQQKQLSVVRSINAQIDNLYQSISTATEDQTKLLKQQIGNLASARDNAKELAGVFSNLVDDSAKLDKSTKYFSMLSEVAKDIPGLRKLSSPFEAASKAARETVINNLKNKVFLEQALKTGKGLTKEKIQQLGLEKEAAGLTGAAAAKRLRDAGVTGQKSATGAGLKAGFADFKESALGGVTAITAGVSILTKVIKFFVDAMFGVDKQTVSLGKNLQISYENAGKLRTYFDGIKDSLRTQYKLTENIIEAQIQLSQLSATSNLYSKDQLDFQILATKQLGLSVEEANSLNKFSIAYKKNSLDVYDSLNATVVQYQKQNKILFRTPEILKQASKVSGELLLSFKGSEKALFNSIMNANKLGVSLEKTKDISNSLLNFEESITAELEAELLTGKDFNLDLARSLALQGDFVGATEAALSNIQGISEFEQMNVLARKASAKALGMTVDELSDALIQQALITNGQKEQYDRFLEFGDKKTAQQLAEGKLDDKAIAAANEKLDAEERFGIQLNRAKETFASFVDSGTLQRLADLIERFIDSVKGTSHYKESIDAAKGKTGYVSNEEESKRIEELSKQAEGPNKAIVVLNSIQKFLTGGMLGIETLDEDYAAADAAKEELKQIKKKIESTPNMGPSYSGQGGGYATGGIVPSGYPNDTFPARLSSNEAIIPLDKLMAKFDIIANTIASVNRSTPNIYLENTRLNSATALGSYELNKGTTGSGR
jgi:hypothetical protein